MPNQPSLEDRYAEQLAEKVSRFASMLRPNAHPPIDVFASPPTGYRQRCEFRIWHEAEQSDYVMFERGGGARYTVETFPPAAATITELMPKLIKHINAHEVVRRRLFRVDFLSTLSGELVVTMVYHKALGADWEAAAQAMREAWGINLIGRSKKQKLVVGEDFVTEILDVADVRYQYRQVEGSFTQPNGPVNQHMLAWASRQANGLGGDLLELYCGNGNFTLPLAKKFDSVLATEISKASIAALEWALDANDVSNVAHARLSAEEMTQALDGARPFRRLAHVSLDAYHFTTIFVDPPRAGVDEATMQLVQRFDNVIYVSCNPATLVDNLAPMLATHTVKSVAAFDQFPFTDHFEAGVLLSRH